VQAPSGVEIEIRTVWQEDELPDEVTKAPGFVPFTLGPETQAWVDSMQEVVDGGTAVYGRPRQAAPTAHRPLTPTPLPSAPPAQGPTPGPSAPPPIARSAPASHEPPPIQMPDIPDGPPRVRTLPQRVMMPEIGEAEPEPQEEHRVMPEVGDDEAVRSPPHPGMPEIGGEEDPPRRKSHMPDIGA
jgi:hypothetical protein